MKKKAVSTRLTLTVKNRPLIPSALTACLTFQIHQRFFQLSQVIAGNMLIGLRPVAESPSSHINGFRINYAVAERSDRIDIYAFQR
jgi:hypothetical protein